MTEEKELDLNELFETSRWRLCPYSLHGCEWVDTYRCNKECEYHPGSYNVREEVLERFRKEPWSIFCFTCDEFLETRFGHPKDHVLATGIAEYREQLPKHIIEILSGREAETGDMSW